jgi:hypothetical protein
LIHSFGIDEMFELFEIFEKSESQKVYGMNIFGTSASKVILTHLFEQKFKTDMCQSRIPFSSISNISIRHSAFVFSFRANTVTFDLNYSDNSFVFGEMIDVMIANSESI